jgi:hypothetical protein
MVEDKSAFRILRCTRTENVAQEGLGIDRRTILEYILKKYMSIQELD